MSGTYLIGMADWLRSAGLNVIEQAGWQTRARSSGGYADGKPWVVMWHHTASNPSSDGQADVNYIVSSQDAPLSNLYINRAGTVWVIAAGATNTNGKGGPYNVSRGQVPLDQMNTHAVGIEVANNGIGEEWPQAQIDAFFAASIALTEALRLEPDDICTHCVWAPGRKIDPATGDGVQGPWRPRETNASGTWNLEDIKAEARARANGILPPTPETTDMAWTQVKAYEAHALFLGWSADGLLPQVEWVNGLDEDQTQRLAAYEQTGKLAHMEIALADFKNITLFGPMPFGDGLLAANGLPPWSSAYFGNVIP